MSDFTELDGVGPARAERFGEAGYDSFEDVATADQEQLAEDVDVPDDTALTFIVQAQNLLDDAAEEEVEEDDESVEFPSQDELDAAAEESEEEEEDEVVENTVSDEAEEEEEEPEPEPESEEPDTYEVDLTFGDGLEYDTFRQAVMNHYERRYGSSQPAEDAMMEVLNQSRGDTDWLSMELTADELNEMHSALVQQRADYQGDNLIHLMDALNQVRNQVDEERERHLF